MTPAGASQLKKEIQIRIEKKTLSEWLSIFQRLDVCVEPVLGLDEVVENPHFQSRGMWVEVETGEGRKQKQIASPLRFSTFQPIYRHIGTPKGAHNHLFS